MHSSPGNARHKSRVYEQLVLVKGLLHRENGRGSTLPGTPPRTEINRIETGIASRTFFTRLDRLSWRVHPHLLLHVGPTI